MGDEKESEQKIFRGRLNAQGYEQEEGKHYYADYIAALVSNPMLIRILLTLLAMNPDWLLKVIYGNCAFLQGRSKNGKELYIETPEGFEQYYEGDVVLLLNILIYGTKQAVACFYKALVENMKDREYE